MSERRNGRLGRKALVALAWLVASAAPVFADQLTCRQLEAELGSAGRSNRSAQYAKYDRAVNAQREQLDLARRQARNAGCGFSFFGGKTGCGQLNAQIDKMQRNLSSLQQTRTQLASGSSRSRSRILADLDANGCRGERVATRTRQERDERASRGSIFDQIFGGNARRRDTLDDDHRRILDDDRVSMAGRSDNSVRRILQEDGRLTIGGGNGDRFSTVCVRTCDGYFFPMSPASTSIEYDRDQKNCESTCPGTDVQLYYRPDIGDDADTMISAATGKSYTDLATAFQYKAVGTPRLPQCGCNPPKNYSVIGGQLPENYRVIETNPPANEPQAEGTDEATAAAPDEPSTSEQSIISIPDARPQPVSEPAKTPPSRGITAEEMHHKQPGDANAGGGGREIRVVGPTFLPDPAEAIDLRAQDQKSVQ